MVNQSKAKDPRFWKKWRDSGAVGTIEDAILRTMQTTRKQLPVCIHVNESAGFYGDIVFNNRTLDVIKSCIKVQTTSLSHLDNASKTMVQNDQLLFNLYFFCNINSPIFPVFI